MSSFRTYDINGFSSFERTAISSIIINVLFITTRTIMFILLYVLRDSPEMKPRGKVPFIVLSLRNVISFLSIILFGVLMVIEQARLQSMQITALGVKLTLIFEEIFLRGVMIFLFGSRVIVHFSYEQQKYQNMYDPLSGEDPDQNNEKDETKKDDAKYNSPSPTRISIIILIVCLTIFLLSDIPMLLSISIGYVFPMIPLIVFQVFHFTASIVQLIFMITIAIIYIIVPEIQRLKMEKRNSEIGDVVHSTRGFTFEKFFVEDDPLYYRFEVLIILAYTLFSCFQFIPSFLLTFISPMYLRDTIIYPFYYSIRFFQEIFHYLAFGGLVLLAKLDQFLKKKRIMKGGSDEDKSSALTKMLSTSVGYKLMFRFCKHEFSVENLLLWSIIVELKQKYATMTSDDRKKAFMDMYDRYVVVGSESEVNLPNTIKSKLKNFMGKDESFEDVEGSLKILYETEQAVMMNLIDTYSRLEITKAYKKYDKGSEASERMKRLYLS